MDTYVSIKAEINNFKEQVNILLCPPHNLRGISADASSCLL